MEKIYKIRVYYIDAHGNNKSVVMQISAGDVDTAFATMYQDFSGSELNDEASPVLVGIDKTVEGRKHYHLVA